MQAADNMRRLHCHHLLRRRSAMLEAEVNSCCRWAAMAVEESNRQFRSSAGKAAEDSLRKSQAAEEKVWEAAGAATGLSRRDSHSPSTLCTRSGTWMSRTASPLEGSEEELKATLQL